MFAQKDCERMQGDGATRKSTGDLISTCVGPKVPTWLLKAAVQPGWFVNVFGLDRANHLLIGCKSSKKCNSQMNFIVEQK